MYSPPHKFGLGGQSPACRGEKMNEKQVSELLASIPCTQGWKRARRSINEKMSEIPSYIRDIQVVFGISKKGGK
jgi:hypothetical protein